MKKILLLEDRGQRQMDLLNKANVDISQYNHVLENIIGKKYSEFIEKIKSDSFDLFPYGVIIAHDSIFSGDENRNILIKLKNYCKATNASLVLFSGGISNAYINEEYEELSLISTDLYSLNLKLFLDEFQKGNKNVLILSYGKHWKLNIILNILEKVSLFLEKNNDQDIDYDEFKNFTHSNLIENLDIKLYEMDVENNWIYRTEIVKFHNDILKHIKDMVDE